MKHGARYVLDTSALLAFLSREDGWERVARAVFSRSLMSIVNWVEVLTEVALSGREPGDVANELRELGVESDLLRVVSLDSSVALRAARFAPKTRGAGLSLGDRVCLALGAAERLPVLTGDSRMTWLDRGVKVEHFRPWCRQAPPPGLKSC